MKYQLVIPMSGFGERFRKAGYTVPKPLIPVDGKPIIAHVLDMFPGEKDVFFICNQDHLDNPEFRMKEILEHYEPNGTVCGIASHKLGPVYAVLQIFDLLKPEAPTIVNYCDFTCTWDFEAFKLFAQKTACDGAIMCYTGFHPHMLGCFNYAYVKNDEQGNVSAIQEKQPYTDTPMQEYASSGTYYFKNAQLMQEAFEETLKRDDLMLKNEFYVSLAYRPLLEKGKRVSVFPIEKFCQWGTPEDLEEWQHHTKNALVSKTKQKRPYVGGICLIPMAGLGSRFVKEGYDIPKPLIPVGDKPMAIKAWEDLPQGDSNIFILRNDMPAHEKIEKTLKELSNNITIVNLSECTDGQARTCLLGLEGVDDTQALTIGACDNGLRYDAKNFENLWRSDVDVIVWTIRNYPNAIKNPQMYGWVDVDSLGNVKRVSVKKPLSDLMGNPMSDPKNDSIITGAFTFRKVKDFKKSVEMMIERKGLINGEFYVDECINDALQLGLKVCVFNVDAYLCWGTPNELKTFEYFQK